MIAQMAEMEARETEAPPTLHSMEAVVPEVRETELSYEPAASFEVSSDPEPEISTSIESLNPIETWQFEVSDAPSVVLNSQPEVESETAPAPQSELLSETADDLASSFMFEFSEADEAGIADTVELVSEDWVATETLETQESSRPEVTQEMLMAGEELAELAKSIDLVQAEKGIESSNAVPAGNSLLLENLKGSDPAKREAALKQLSKLDESTAFGLITSLFDDESAETRNVAARALYGLKSDRAASFTRVLREATVDGRRRIAAALADSGIAAEAINSLAGESREKTYEAFSVLFLMAKAGEVKTLLKKIETHESIPVRLSVIKLLTFSNQPDVIPAFRSLAVRGSLPTEIRSALMESIYQISSNARENSLSAA
jgi:hypothetical protein